MGVLTMLRHQYHFKLVYLIIVTYVDLNKSDTSGSHKFNGIMHTLACITYIDSAHFT